MVTIRSNRFTRAFWQPDFRFHWKLRWISVFPLLAEDSLAIVLKKDISFTSEAADQARSARQSSPQAERAGTRVRSTLKPL